MRIFLMDIDQDIYYFIHTNQVILDMSERILVKLGQHKDKLMQSMMSHIIVFQGHQIVLQDMD